ncbi:hypothetical protein [Bacillus bingmayongensis]|uniref:hypothetical protein n=1 Tax=Bacillus bingmayongensis TaxID=1150157 RepID=UPI0002F73F04|nr:hypothetical protein [Bacillus bingmayongensis]
MDNRGLPPEELKELRRQRKAEKNKAKMALERQRKREKQLKNADKEKEKAKREFEAMNNIVRESDQAKKVRGKFQEKAKPTIGKSKNNKKWEQKRKDRYNQRVWRGWREKDGEESPVISYNIKDLEKEN